MAKYYKLVVYVPVDSASKIRALLGKLGAGHVGNYDYTSFSVRGVGRFRPLEGANPTIGEIGKIEVIEEERIETVVTEDLLEKVVQELRFCHPYEEPVIDVYELHDF